MAEGFARRHGKGVIDAWSAGSKPSGKVNETGIAVMKEKGIDLSAHLSKGLTDVPTTEWDYVITMGCGDACPFVPSRRTEDWGIPDPKHLPLEDFRRVRDMVETRVKALIDEARSAS